MHLPSLAGAGAAAPASTPAGIVLEYMKIAWPPGHVDAVNTALHFLQ